MDRNIITVFDLELNRDKIVEIGALVGNVRTGEIISTYSSLCRVRPNHDWDWHALRLTKIPRREILRAPELKWVIKDLNAMGYHRHPCFYYGDDYEEIKRTDYRPPFSEKHFDYSTLLRTLYSQTMTVGLAEVYSVVCPEGHIGWHRALPDSIATFEVICRTMFHRHEGLLEHLDMRERRLRRESDKQERNVIHIPRPIRNHS